MKVRASKNIHDYQKTFDEFKLTEFSKDRERFVPDLSLSCNECLDKEDDAQGTDSTLSFLIKFKADKLSDPRSIRDDGVSGMILPEIEGLPYKKEAGAASIFKTITENHYNLELSEAQLDWLADQVFKDKKMTVEHNASEVKDYLISSYEKTEWATLLKDAKKSRWKSYLKKSLKDQFKNQYCELKVAELNKMLGVDAEGLKAAILRLNVLGCFEGAELNEIRQSLGKTFV